MLDAANEPEPPEIDVDVLDIQPHPDQATNNPGCWAVQLQVTRNGNSRTFWRWFAVRETRDGRYVTPSAKKPLAYEVIARFWDDTFAKLHGFSFNKEDP